MTDLYEVYLACLCCGQELVLGCVEAHSAYEAKLFAEVRWPDARYEEMHARVKQEARNVSLVEEVA